MTRTLRGAVAKAVREGTEVTIHLQSVRSLAHAAIRLGQHYKEASLSDVCAILGISRVAPSTSENRRIITNRLGFKRIQWMRRNREIEVTAQD